MRRCGGFKDFGEYLLIELVGTGDVADAEEVEDGAALGEDVGFFDCRICSRKREVLLVSSHAI